MNRTDKYIFREIAFRQEPLPDDINSPMEEIAQKFEDAAALNEIKKYRQKRLFGEVVIIKDGQVKAIGNFQRGICPSYKLYRWRETGETLSVATIFNHKVDMRKERKNPKRKQNNANGENREQTETETTNKE